MAKNKRRKKRPSYLRLVKPNETAPVKKNKRDVYMVSLSAALVLLSVVWYMMSQSVYAIIGGGLGGFYLMYFIHRLMTHRAVEGRLNRELKQILGK